MTNPADVSTGSVPQISRWPLSLLALFTLSGATGLMLEVVWSRMLTTLLGVTTWGLLTILVTYMGGLGLGAILLGRQASRSRDPLRFYARLEIAIGVYALLVPLIFRAIAWAYVGMSRWDESSALSLAWAVRLVAAVLALGLPTLLLGGTFPALVRAVGTQNARHGHGAALLYALNTTGAVVGCFVTGFILIGNLGVFATNTLAGLIDIGIGTLAFLVSRRGAYHDSSPEADSRSTTQTGGTRTAWLILLVATYSGFCGLAFEVLWTRGLLVALVDNTTYAFTMMLSAFLLGHAVGSGWVGSGRGVAREDQLKLRLSWVVAMAGWFALISLPVLILASDLVGRLAYGAGVTFWGRRIPVQMGLCLLVVAPAAAMLGASFALAARLVIGQGHASARQAGRLYGLNTLGAILGAILTQMVFIPIWGTQGTLAILALGLVGAGVLVQLRVSGLKGLTVSLAMAVVAIGLGWVSQQFSLIDLYASKERMQRADAPARLLGVIESPGAIVTIHERAANDKVINLNGTNVAGTNPVLRTIQTLQGELPLMLHQHPRKVLQIGFGSGGTYATLSAARSSEMAVEVLELTPEVIKASERWLDDVNFRKLSSSKDKITINDARSHMAATLSKYDLILSDSIHPRFRGNASLYSRDYFELCSRRLNEGGLFSTWLPLYGISTEDLRGIFASLHAVFPHIQIWYPNAEPNENTILVGSMNPIVVDFKRFESVLAEGLTSTSPASRLRLSPVRVLDFFLMGDAGVARFASGGKVSTDDRPYLEFDAPRTLDRQGSWLANLKALSVDRESVLSYLTGASPETRQAIERWTEATRFKLLGQEAELARDFAGARASYARCLQVNPDDQDTRRRKAGLDRLAP